MLCRCPCNESVKPWENQLLPLPLQKPHKCIKLFIVYFPIGRKSFQTWKFLLVRVFFYERHNDCNDCKTALFILILWKTNIFMHPFHVHFVLPLIEKSFGTKTAFKSFLVQVSRVFMPYTIPEVYKHSVAESTPMLFLPLGWLHRSMPWWKHHYKKINK